MSALTTPHGCTFYNGRLYIVDGAASLVHVFTAAGAAESTIDVSGFGGTQPYGIWISASGELYISEDNVGVFRRVAAL